MNRNEAKKLLSNILDDLIKFEMDNMVSEKVEDILEKTRTNLFYFRDNWFNLQDNASSMRIEIPEPLVSGGCNPRCLIIDKCDMKTNLPEPCLYVKGPGPGCPRYKGAKSPLEKGLQNE